VVVGVYEYIVAALPIYERLAAFLLSIKGSKIEGIESIRQAANGGGEASIDAKTALSLFLVRERQYPEALSEMRELYHSYPHNFLYGLSEADMLRSSGNVPEAIAAYRNLLVLGQRNVFPHARLDRAAIHLGQTLQSQGEYRAAATAFESVDQIPGTDRDRVETSKLLAGEMYDLLQERDSAIGKYQEVIAMDHDSKDSTEARYLLKHPYH
jgi:tetratricopeptide (TPR) repeat protein